MAAGVRKLVTGYLGQRPVLTVNKWHCAGCLVKKPLLGWHQEASVFSSRTRTVNFWIALSECGDDAAGIEVLPYRVDHIVAPPEKQYGLSDATVDSLDIGEPVAPVFAPGDALVFDDLLLHRTHMSDRVTKAALFDRDVVLRSQPRSPRPRPDRLLTSSPVSRPHAAVLSPPEFEERVFELPEEFQGLIPGQGRRAGRQHGDRPTPVLD